MLLVSTFSRIQLLDSANVVSNSMIVFHDFCLAILMFILTFVMFMFFICINTNKFMRLFKSYSFNMLEMIWTIFPAVILVILSIPSFMMMYFLESESKGDLTVKAVGHQWFWSYESGDFYSFDFDSYMKQESDLMVGENRTLEVDNSLVLPMSTKVRMIITSTDVLHSWALPSMALKMDAVPSRLNTMNIMSLGSSSFYGQCSEICSINHSFMPIHVEFVSWSDYLKTLITL